jgi:hypothetical protein
VLDVVDELELYNDTLVILTGDHGWQLGEHAEWGKHTNWELAVQVPLIIRAPWTNTAGTQWLCNRLSPLHWLFTSNALCLLPLQISELSEPKEEQVCNQVGCSRCATPLT